jgi:hypothetical protein
MNCTFADHNRKRNDGIGYNETLVSSNGNGIHLNVLRSSLKSRHENHYIFSINLCSHKSNLLTFSHEVNNNSRSALLCLNVSLLQIYTNACKKIRSTLPRLCQEISNVIDMNVRKEKNGILSILQITYLHTELLKTCSVAQLVSTNRCCLKIASKQQRLTTRGILWVGLNSILDIKTSSIFFL